MSKPAVRVEVSGLAAAVRAVRAVPIDAQRAALSAGREARKSARSRAAKAIAARWGIVQKVVRKRIQAFLHPRQHGAHRLWMGLRALPRAGEHKSVRRALERRGNVRGRLPIGEGAEAILNDAASEAMRDRYIPVLRRDLNRRIAKRRIRRASRRG